MTGENLEEGDEEKENPKQGLEDTSGKTLESFSITNLPFTETPSAEPSKSSQFLAFGSILLGGLCGGLIGFAFTDLQCSGSCSGWSGMGGLIGALVGAGGVGIVSILVLRAMNEWKTKSHYQNNTKAK